MPCSKTVAPGFEIDLSWGARSGRGVFRLCTRYAVVVEDFNETWESVRLEPHEFIEAGDLVVVP